MKMKKRVILRRGREESILRFHPWVFSGAIVRSEGEIAEGDIVEVVSAAGGTLGYGHFQVGSIAVRMLSFGENVPGKRFWTEKLSAAYSLRVSAGVVRADNTAYRLVHGEGDMLPGLIVDIYGKTAVMQAHSAGMFLAREEIAEALRALYGDKLTAVYDKSSSTAPFKASLDLMDQYLYGKREGEEIVKENGLLFSVDWIHGQKTGFFLDQRDNRELLGKYSSGKRVLNLFCYTGGFSIYSLAKGAKSVDSVDSSAKAMKMLERNIEINREAGLIDKDIVHNSFTEDAIDFLRESSGNRYDLIIVDPPAFAKHRGAMQNALRAYQRLNAAAISRVAPGGIIFTYSCSQVVDKIAFAEAVFSAAAATGRVVRILHRLTQPADHPVSIYHPEGEYLKGLVLYVE
jgi:23S rRNA (cytosine1962-C5)-methyltransferase